MLCVDISRCLDIYTSTHRIGCVDIRRGLDIYTAKHRMVAECRLSWQWGTECCGHVGSRWADNDETITLCRPHVSILYLLSDTGLIILWRIVHVSVYSNIWPLSPKMQCLKETLLSPSIWYWYRFWRHNAIEKITYSGLSYVLCPLS